LFIWLFVYLIGELYRRRQLLGCLSLFMEGMVVIETVCRFDFPIEMDVFFDELSVDGILYVVIRKILDKICFLCCVFVKG